MCHKNCTSIEFGSGTFAYPHTRRQHALLKMTSLPIFLVLVLLLSLATPSNGFLVSVADDQEIEAIANPSLPDVCSGNALLDRLLDPFQLITKPMMTQADTFQELSYAKVLTVPVPVYTMQQSARISESQLQFQLVLVKALSPMATRAVKEVPVPMERAVDSWFPGYYWTPLIMACGGDDNWQHVGWKFTALENNDVNHAFSHFYALMVHMDPKETTQSVRIGGFRAPGWMVGAVLS